MAATRVPKKPALTWRGIVARFFFISAFLFSFYNPFGLHALSFLRSVSIGFWPELLVIVVYLAVFVALLRQTWCGLDPYGRFVPLVLAVGISALLWDYGRGEGESSSTALVLWIILALSLILTLGQISAFYIRQISGQSPVLKTPP